ncbi:MAG: PAS domain S-box protein [Gammaproteobacteria bacterium]
MNSHNHNIAPLSTAADERERPWGAWREGEQGLRALLDHLRRLLFRRGRRGDRPLDRYPPASSAQKQVEIALRENERRLESMIAGAQLGTWDWDVTSGRNMFNARWAEMLGYTRAEVEQFPGNFWEQHLHPQDKPRVLAALNRHVEGGSELYNAEYRMLTRSGTWKWILALGKALERDARGKAVRITGTHLDITERKNAEQTLAESEERFRNLVESSLQGIFVHGDGRVLFANQALATMLGYASPAEVLALDSISGVLLPAPHDRARAAASAALADPHTPSEFEAVRKNGAPITLQILARAIVWDGRPAEQVAVIDVTERKRAELQLSRTNAELRAANDELAASARAKDAFLASMSHELRTPLNAVLGLSEILQTGSSGTLNDKQRQYARMIHDSGRHLLALITDILDIASVGAGKMSLHFDDVLVDSICRASLQMVKQDADKKHLHIGVHIDPQVCAMRADERRLIQILVNLLSNSIKFTPSGGNIGLQVTGNAEAQIIQFTVWDTGIGVPREAMKRLFQPFVQLDDRLAREHSGTGLGLSLVYYMVEMHGGSIAVESEPGKGSRFVASLPWLQIDMGDDSAVAEASAAPAPTPVLKVYRPRILLAEDNDSNILFLSDYLRAHGCRIEIARNGVEAIRRARELRPDLILMDIQMPGMDGLEAISRLRTDAELRATPIIALTALVMPGDRERCLAAGADEYLSKPVDLRGLLQHIDDQLQRRGTLD